MTFPLCFCLDGPPPVDGARKENLRSKPLSGKLQIAVMGAREIEHAPVITSWKSRSASKQAVETFVSLKVEGTQRARSHPSRTDRWNEEFEISVDKGNEVEITIYDKQVSEVYPNPIGMLWVKIGDLLEAQRRQKVEQESGQGGWVTAAAAGAMGGDNGQYPDQGYGSLRGDGNSPLNNSGFSGQSPSNQPEGVEGWFSVEPAGAIYLRLNFSKN